jgi:hypothetical protein
VMMSIDEPRRNDFSRTIQHSAIEFEYQTLSNFAYFASLNENIIVVEKFDFISLMEEDRAVIKEDGVRHFEIEFLLRAWKGIGSSNLVYINGIYNKRNKYKYRCMNCKSIMPCSNVVGLRTELGRDKSDSLKSVGSILSARVGEASPIRLHLGVVNTLWMIRHCVGLILSIDICLFHLARMPVVILVNVFLVSTFHTIDIR